jgi:hypothetical protein
MMVTGAHWVHRFNHRRLYQYCVDIPPLELEAAYYAHHQRTAGLSSHTKKSPGSPARFRLLEKPS